MGETKLLMRERFAQGQTSAGFFGVSLRLSYQSADKPRRFMMIRRTT